MGWKIPSRRWLTLSDGRGSTRVGARSACCRLGPLPDGVLLGPGEHGDGLGQFGVGRQLAVGVRVGENVTQG